MSLVAFSLSIPDLGRVPAFGWVPKLPETGALDDTTFDLKVSDPSRVRIEKLRSLGRDDVASRLLVLDTLDFEDDPDDVRLNQRALSSLSRLLKDRQIADPALTSVRGEIWGQWETPAFSTYILFKADGKVDYGQTRKADGGPGECRDNASLPSARETLWDSLVE